MVGNLFSWALQKVELKTCDHQGLVKAGKRKNHISWEECFLNYVSRNPCSEKSVPQVALLATLDKPLTQARHPGFHTEGPNQEDSGKALWFLPVS